MKISKLKIRRLIRESIESMINADFVGTPDGEIMLPQDIINAAKNWVSQNTKTIQRLEKLNSDVVMGQTFTDSAGNYDPQKHNRFKNQLNSLKSALGADAIPGGLKLQEMSRIIDKYIIELGNILIEKHPGFKKFEETLSSPASQPGGYSKAMTDEAQPFINQANSLWEIFWPEVDVIGLGNVSYGDYIQAKDRAYIGPRGKYGGRRKKTERDVGVNRLHGTVNDPFLNPDLADELKNKRARRETSAQDKKYNLITNQLNSGNTNITSDVGLFKVTISYGFSYYTYDGGTQTEYVENDTILEFNPDDAQNVVDEIIGELNRVNDNGIIISETNDNLFSYFFLARLNELKGALSQALVNIGRIDTEGEYGNDVPIYYEDFDYKIENIIKPNSMESLKEFFNKINSGVPTDATSAQKIRIDHENALEYAMYTELASTTGNSYPLSQNDEDFGNDVLSKISDVLRKI